MAKQVGTWIAVALGWGLVLAAKEFFGISDFAMWLALIAIIGVVVSYNLESRLRNVEEKVVHPDYRGIIALLEGERHKPQHKQPESLESGGAVVSFITPEHRVIFEDFRWFAAVLNMHLADPWAIEELDDTNIWNEAGPEMGRKYAVWYNACKVGTMHVTVGSGALLQQDRSEGEKSAFLDLKLNYLRFIPYRDAHHLLYELSIMVGRFDRQNADLSRAKASAIASDALAGHLWEAVREPETDPFFDFTVEGSYDLLIGQTDHWKRSGIDPVLKWGGDRSRD